MFLHRKCLGCEETYSFWDAHMHDSHSQELCECIQSRIGLKASTFTKHWSHTEVPFKNDTSFDLLHLTFALQKQKTLQRPCHLHLKNKNGDRSTKKVLTQLHIHQNSFICTAFICLFCHLLNADNLPQRFALLGRDHAKLSQVLENTQPCAVSAQTCQTPRKAARGGLLTASCGVPASTALWEGVLPRSISPATAWANEKSMKRICMHFPPPLNPQRASHSLTLT